MNAISLSGLRIMLEDLGTEFLVTGVRPYGDMYQSVPVKIMDDVVYVSGSAAIKSDGSLWMWGSNSFGQLMYKNVGDQLDSHGDRYQSVPVKVMDDVIFVDAVDTTIAAIKSDGSLWMWGSDYDGKLGCGSEYAPENLPVKVLNDVAAVSVGHNVAAVKRDGSLWMWGPNQNGQIPELKNVTAVYTPTKVLDGVSAVYCSSVEPMAIKYYVKGRETASEAVAAVDRLYMDPQGKSCKKVAND